MPRSLVAAGFVAVALALGWWMSGDAPRPVDAGAPKEPPPMALPSDLSAGSDVARAAARLATGDLDAARRGFTAAVAEHPDDVVAQAGLVLSRWRSTGPRSVERDLTQLAREYPDSAFAALHLGLVRRLLGDASAEAPLREAVRLGRADGDATGRRTARLADDVLHPGSFRGYLPVLVRAREVRAADRGRLRELLAAIGDDDRVRAGALGEALDRSTDPMSRVAGAAARFSKDDPDATADRLEAVAREAGTRGPGAAAHHRALLMASLARAWSGRDRDGACTGIRRAADRAASDSPTAALAAPIAREICT